jgi:ABC-type sugar transport system ATPase subunit
MSSLAIESVVKRFGPDVTALNQISFELADQEMVFLLGPSGAGKTTALRIIAGLEDPCAGRVWIGGCEVTPLAPRERNVAMVYDKHSLFPHMSVFENMAYPLRVRKTDEHKMRERIHQVAEILQITHLLERRPNQLSGGQMQRTAIGRALVREADVFLMDEPISHLDAKLRAHMRVEFKKLQKDFGATILYVSHDQLEALTMADRIVVMNQGVKQQTGTPQQVFDTPANLFVATFVGEPSMNVLPCALLRNGATLLLAGSGFAIEAPPDWLDSGLALGGGECMLGVRPHHITMVGPEQRATPNVLEGKVYAVESMGSERIYDIEIGAAVIRVRAETAKTGFVDAEVGHTAWCRIDPNKLYLFDLHTHETVAQARFTRA